LADVEPAPTITLTGTVAAALSLDKVTVLCAAVPTAGALKVTVPVAFASPPGTLDGFMLTKATVTGLTASVAVAGPFKVAVIKTLFVALTTLEFTVNVAVVAPTGTVTETGTVAAAGVSLDSVTFRCAAVPAAGAFNVTVATGFVAPPTTLLVFSIRDAIPGGGVTVSVAPWGAPFIVAVIFAVFVVVTERLDTVKVAEVWFAGTITVAGTVAAAGLSFDSVTVR
jgi:hypothetical protein